MNHFQVSEVGAWIETTSSTLFVAKKWGGKGVRNSWRNRTWRIQCRIQ